MAEITNEYMRDMLTKGKNYTLVILKHTDKIHEKGFEKTKYEHGKRNFLLREDGIISIVCRINDESNLSGIAIFNRDPHEVKKIMDGDPVVIAGIFSYEIHLCNSFIGDKLP